MSRWWSLAVVIAVIFVGLVAVAAAARADEVVRPLSLEVVDRVVEQNDRAVQACARTRAHDTLAVLVRLEIDAEGRVTAAQAAWPTAESRCLERVARRFRFPPTGTATHVDFPFLLEPRIRR
jgi:hypothetical protein